MKRYFLKIYIYIFCNFRRNFRKITFFLTTYALLAVEGYFAYQVKQIDVFYKKINCHFRKKGFEKFRRNFRKKCHFAYSFFVIHGKIMVGIPLHACGVTRNWRTYFTSVRRVFLIETFVLQTTVRHPGVERPFSSYFFISQILVGRMW